MTIEVLLARVSREIVNPLIVLLFAIALVVFVWGAFVFIVNADNDGERSTGKQHMLWGIIGMAIMASAFAIIEIVANTFGISGVALP